MLRISLYQSAFEAGGEIVAATHDKHRFVAVDLLGEVGNLVIARQHFLDLVGQVFQALDNLPARQTKVPF